MDFTLIIKPVIKPLLWVLPLFIVIGLLRTPLVKGLVGEAFIKILARIKLPKDVYIPLHNVTLPTDAGSTQIDHIFVSKYGVFVVETKNMKGWIFGGEKQKKWTQTIYKTKHHFQNPLHQNYKHVKTLEEALDLPSDSIKSVVAFIGDSRFKSDMPDNVTHGIGYVRYIKSFSVALLTEEQVQVAVKQIQSRRLEPSRTTDRAHVQQLTARHDPGSGEVCTRCGKPMVLRTAKRGASSGKQFWGCSGYPKCRAMQNVT